MSFKTKLFLSFIFYGLVLVLFTQLVIYKLEEIDIKANSIQKASQTFHERNKTFKSYIDNTKLELLAIKNSQVFNRYLSNTKDTSEVSSLFLDIASTSNNIMQLRYLDNKGMERLRIDRKSFASKPYLIEDKNLQNKANRYYFKETLNIDENKFWYSKLDLNIEHGKIEKPIKPVLRVAIPIFHKGEKAGILIINIFMKKFLEDLVSVPFHNIYLLDGKGNPLVDSVHKHCWSSYLDKNKSTDTHFEKDLTVILTSDEYLGENIYASKLFLANSEDIHMIVEPKKSYISEELSSYFSELGWVMLIVIVFSFPFSYFISRIPSKLKDEVDKQKSEQDILLSLFDLSDAGLIKWNNDEKWSINFVSKSVTKLLEHSQEDLENNTVLYASCIHPDDIERVKHEVSDAVNNKVYFFEHEPYRIITKNTHIKWILDSTVIVRNSDEEIISFVGYLTDITELKNNEIALKNISRTDQLTKISNRMHLDDILQNQYYRYYRDEEVCSVIMVDIDYFKLVNDQFGHLVGDSVLIEFANLLKSSIRAGDTVGRWGGEEFLIILPHTNLDQAIILAEKLRKLVENYIFITVKHKTASFGIATFDKGITIQTLLDSADSALYQSKNSGRNCVSSFQETSND